jgi:hypothetical protein
LLALEVPFHPDGAAATPIIFIPFVLATGFVALVENDLHIGPYTGVTVHGQHRFFKITAK